jgi:hypothetical protein
MRTLAIGLIGLNFAVLAILTWSRLHAAPCPNNFADKDACESGTYYTCAGQLNQTHCEATIEKVVYTNRFKCTSSAGSNTICAIVTNDKGETVMVDCASNYECYWDFTGEKCLKPVQFTPSYQKYYRTLDCE